MNHSLFEYVICKVASTHSGYLATVSNYCDETYFDNPDARVWIKVLFDQYQKIGKIPTLTEMKISCDEDELHYLDICKKQMDAIDGGLDSTLLLSNTEKFLREKGLRNELVDINQQMMRDGGELKTLSLEDISSKITRLHTINMVNNSGWDFFEKLDDLGKELIKPNRKISTGLPWLDGKMDGGWDADGKVLYAFAGQPNIGKSIFLGHVAKSGVEQGKNVILITLEMSEAKYAHRLAASMSQVPMRDMRHKIPEMVSKVSEYGKRTRGKLRIKEFPTRGVSVSQIGAWIQDQIRHGFEPDMIVIDYLNLILSGKKTNGKYEEVLEVAEQLRGQSYRFGCPFISATQLNRDGYGKENPGMETTSESSGLCATVDGQYSIFQSDSDRELGIIRLGIQKQRDGEKGGVDVIRVDYPTMTLTEVNDDLDVPSGSPMGSVQSTACNFFQT